MFEIDQSKFEASYESFLNAIHPDDRDAVNQAYTNSLTTRQPYEIVHRLKMADGRIKYVRETCESVFDADGKPLTSIGTVQDISERHETEVALRNSEQRLREAEQMAHTGAWELDLTSNLAWWSDEQYRMNGIAKSNAPLHQDIFMSLVHPDDRELISNAFKELITKGTFEGEFRIVRPDGEVRHIHGLVKTSYDETGRPVRLTGTNQDITERKRTEVELLRYREHLEELVRDRTAGLEAAKNDAERANKAKSEFLARMSHELRTPMNAIIGFSQVLEVEQINDEQLDFVHEIHRAGDHLLELINELLDLSRIEVGKLVTVLRPVNIQSAVTDAVQITQMLVSAKQISLIDQCDAHATVLADPTRLKQILVNLLSNAAKYNRDGGRILLDCHSRDGGILRLAVTDTGPGIPADKLDRLFKPFERLGAEFSAVEGAGIGLALSKQLAELMGGTLGITSTPGEGSTFWVDLPRAPEMALTETLAQPDMQASADTRQLKVLYVEDNAANLRLVEVIFKRHSNLTLLSAIDGELGLELARHYLPEAILLDIHLPGMDGYAVLKELQADPATRNIPVIALSADAMQIDIEKGLKAGFAEYLTKPLNVGELMQSIERCLPGAVASSI